MKATIAIVIIFITQVLCETDKDVIEEFSTIFRRYYDQIEEISSQNMEAMNGNNIILSNSSYGVQMSILREQLQQKISIRNEIGRILNEVNLPGDSIQVQNCIYYNNLNIKDLVSRSWGGVSACEVSVMAQVKKATYIMSAEYDRIMKVNSRIQASSRSCAEISSSPAQLRNCLYHDLLVEHIKTIEKLRQEDGQVIDGTSSVMERAAEQLQKCSNNVLKVLRDDGEYIVQQFRDCVTTKH